MGTEYGKDWRIHIGNGAEPQVFVVIGGELSFDWQRQSQEVDDSTKDDGEYGSTHYNQIKITFNVSGNVKLPDVGLERASDVSKSATRTETVRVMRGAVKKFEGLVAIGNFSSSHPKDGPVTYSFTMANKGAPALDDIGATGA